SVTVTTPFTMTANPSSLSVPAGQSAIYPITVTPVGGFTGTVNFTNSTSTNAGSCPSGLPAGALCVFSPPSVTLDGVHTQSVTLTITTAANMALPSGPQTVTVTGTSGTANVPMTVSLTVSATNESFTLAATNGGGTYSITVGASAPVNLSVTGMGAPINFVTNSTTALNLAYTCTGSPSLTTSEITCQLPNNGQPTNAASVSVTLVTTPATSELRRPLGGSRIFYAMLLPGLLGIVFVAGPLRRRRMFGVLTILVCASIGMGSCGGSSSSNNNNLSNPGTPAGKYTVTISATTGGATPLTSSTSITLNVGQ
ncbi:MAG TPA: hypothetical protein VND65_02770, partial [Candidatus Binatia bacterium]|nr:hypothetical protein [Candidatus Binatia bacterium]